MSNKITEETKKAVLKMHKQGASKAEIAKKHNISPRSVGRIIDSDVVKISKIKAKNDTAKNDNSHNNQSKKWTDNFDSYEDFQEQVLEQFEPNGKKNYEGLLPCPFCGGNAKIKSETLPEGCSDFETAYYVECSDCHLMTVPVHAGLQERHGHNKPREISTAEAIRRIVVLWNRRFKSKKGDNVND